MATVDSRDYVLSRIYNYVFEPRHVRNIMRFFNTQTRDVDPMLLQCWPPSATLAQHQTSTGLMPHVCWDVCNISWSDGDYCWRQLQADTEPMSVKCLASPSQYFMLAVPTHALNQSWVNVGLPSVMLAHIQRRAKHDTVTQYCANVDSAS